MSKKVERYVARTASKDELHVSRTALYGLPPDGFLKEKEIIKQPKSTKPALIPVSRSTWLAGIKDKIYPAPVKIGKRSIAWRVQDIRDLIEKLGEQQ